MARRSSVVLGGWLVLLAALAIVALHDDYGITWDEPVHSMYGDLVRSYFVSGGVDRRSETFLDFRYYGVLGDLLPSLIHPANDRVKYDVRHLVCGLFAVLAVAATWRFGRRAPDTLVGIFAALALATMPRFVGHAFDNLKDVPFAAALATLMATLAWLAIARKGGTGAIGLAGLTAGFVLAVRPGGFPIVAALSAASLGIASWTVGWPGSAAPASLGAWLRRLAVILGIAWVVMVLPWPYAHSNPLGHPVQAMAIAGAFPYSPEVLYDGVSVPSADLPRSYLSRMLLITTPPTILLLAVVGLGGMVRAQVAAPRSEAACVYGMTQVWLLAPLVALAAAHANVYDGIRHILFVLPALAITAAVGAVTLVGLLPARSRRLGVAGAVLLVAAPVGELARLHPYQTTYYNAFVGGVAGAEGRFETDYWVSSYKEAFEWVNTRARQEPGRVFRVLMAGTPYLEPLGQLYRASNMTTEVVREIGPERLLPDGVDYCIATSRWGYAKRLFPDAPVVHSIGRDGAAFTVIRGRERAR